MLGRPSEGGAQHERRLHRVLGGLVEDHPLSAGEGVLVVDGRPGALLDEVEVLARRDVDPHLLPLRPGGEGGVPVIGIEQALRHQVVAPGEQQIAEQDRGRGAEGRRGRRPTGSLMESLEAAMRRRRTPPGVRAVDEIVVHEGCGVEHLDGAGERDDALQLHLGRPVSELGNRIERRPADPLPAPVGEQGPEPLATSEKLPRKGPERGDLLRYSGKNQRAVIDQSIQSRLDQVDQAGALDHTA